MRGDGKRAAASGRVASGSPPRAWGRRNDRRRKVSDYRFTPTCVGTAQTATPQGQPHPVHPHVRGDGRPSGRSDLHRHGSPPRAWGRLVVVVLHVLRHRFTPTCVGTARGRSLGGLSLPVHPHVRGDGAMVHTSENASIGSPPRAWGRRSPSGLTAAASRFTPTCVGTAQRDRPHLGQSAVHPHVRGDGEAALALAEAVGGSPPRAWGRLNRRELAIADIRFTPTCVGTAGAPSQITSMRSVHPHVRGDGSNGGAGFRDAHGSPPRAWGRRHAIGRGSTGHRFTPTCVGTASTPAQSRGQDPVHPHVRGDGVFARREFERPVGSPPRAWGRQQVSRYGEAWLRFTPTCVGTAYTPLDTPVNPPVHPHVRGDGDAAFHREAADPGSPPRAWGRRSRLDKTAD